MDLIEILASEANLECSMREGAQGTNLPLHIVSKGARHFYIREQDGRIILFNDYERGLFHIPMTLLDCSQTIEILRIIFGAFEKGCDEILDLIDQLWITISTYTQYGCGQCFYLTTNIGELHNHIIKTHRNLKAKWMENIFDRGTG